MFPPTALTLGLKEDEVLLALLCHFQTLLFLSPPRHRLSVEELLGPEKTVPIPLLLDVIDKHFLPSSEWRHLQMH